MYKNCVGYYLDTYETLLPSDTSLGEVAEHLWFVYIKGKFNDMVWADFYDREVFNNHKFPSSDPESAYDNIIKTIKIRMINKDRIYDRMFNTFMADYNPLWNVDGVTGTIRETNGTNTGTDTDAKSGKDTTLTEDNGTITKSGNEQIAEGGSDVVTGANTTFDSATFHDTNKSTSNYGRTDTHTYNSVRDTRDLDGRNETTYASQNQRTLNLANYQKDLELIIRQGNIGTTKSSELLLDSLNLYNTDIMDFVKVVTNDCINQVAYMIY